MCFFLFHLSILEKIRNICLHCWLLFLFGNFFLTFFFHIHIFHKLINLLIIFYFFASLFLFLLLLFLLDIIVVLDFKTGKFLGFGILGLIFFIVEFFLFRSWRYKVLILTVMLAMFSEPFLRSVNFFRVFRNDKLLQIFLGGFFFDRFDLRLSFGFGHMNKN